MERNADAVASDVDTVASGTVASDAVASNADTVASDTVASNADTVASDTVVSDTMASNTAPHPHAPHVHHVPGGYVVDLPPHNATDRIALGCVFARDLTEAIKRLDVMRAALVAARATTSPKDTDDA